MLLRIAKGVLATDEIGRRGYGSAVPVDFDTLEALPLP